MTEATREPTLVTITLPGGWSHWCTLTESEVGRYLWTPRLRVALRRNGRRTFNVRVHPRDHGRLAMVHGWRPADLDATLEVTLWLLQRMTPEGLDLLVSGPGAREAIQEAERAVGRLAYGDDP